jgi:hypothetical protein
MRVTFPRLPDHRRGHALITRDDGVCYRMLGGPVTAAIPHDLMHFTVERALRMPDGIWGAIAGGVVFRSMTHVSGRRRPHAAQRSTDLIREYGDRLRYAELVGGLVERVAQQEAASPDQVRRLAVRYLTTRPHGELDPDRIPPAVAEVRAMADRWADLDVGTELVLDWPAQLHLPAPQPSPRRAR